MTITIENKADSKIALLEIVRKEKGYELVPFSFPSQIIFIAPGIIKYLTRVPLLESPDNNSLIPLNYARESIPSEEAIGKGLDGYYIESSQEGEGGKVNETSIQPKTQIEDQGINFIGN